jgi:hypothetical protein
VRTVEPLLNLKCSDGPQTERVQTKNYRDERQILVRPVKTNRDIRFSVRCEYDKIDIVCIVFDNLASYTVSHPHTVTGTAAGDARPIDAPALIRTVYLLWG